MVGKGGFKFDFTYNHFTKKLWKHFNKIPLKTIIRSFYSVLFQGLCRHHAWLRYNILKSLKGWEYSHIQEHLIHYVISLHLKQCFCDSSNSENCQLLRAVRYMSVFTNGWCVWKLPSLQTEGWRASPQLHLWSCSPWLPLISGLLQGCSCSVHGFNHTLSTDSTKIKHGTQFFIRTGWLQILAFWRKRKREENKKELLRFSLGRAL